jgi:hypothetical protein
MAKRIAPAKLNVTPSDQATFNFSDNPWNSMVQPLCDELLHVLKRWRFQERQKLALPCDAIKARPEIGYVNFGDWCDFDLHNA